MTKLQSIKHHTCPRCEAQAILLVKIGTNAPSLDHKGFRRYHCIKCGQNFSVDYQGKRVRA